MQAARYAAPQYGRHRAGILRAIIVIKKSYGGTRES
jgi:hypothetical protein